MNTAMAPSEPEIIFKKAPQVEYHFTDVLVTLLAAAVMPVYLYGLQVVWLLLTAAATALITEYLCVRLRGKKSIDRKDYSCLVTALITVLLLPATAPWWMAMTSVLIALAVAKHPFGGTGHNIFNPAAAGLAFCAICWPEIVMKYPVPYSTYNPSKIQYASSPASVLRVGGTPKIDLFDILLGKYAGPMGATCMIVLVCCLLYLLFRKKASLPIVLASLAVVGGWAFFFPRVVTGEIASLTFELSSGAFLFGIIFLANDPATMPHSRGGQLFYGILIGAAVIALRVYGVMDLEFVYAILLANVFASSCDQYAAWIGKKWRKLTRRKPEKAAFSAGEPAMSGTAGGKSHA